MRRSRVASRERREEESLVKFVLALCRIDWPSKPARKQGKSLGISTQLSSLSLPLSPCSCFALLSYLIFQCATNTHTKSTIDDLLEKKWTICQPHCNNFSLFSVHSFISARFVDCLLTEFCQPPPNDILLVAGNGGNSDTVAGNFTVCTLDHSFPFTFVHYKNIVHCSQLVHKDCWCVSVCLQYWKTRKKEKRKKFTFEQAQKFSIAGA